jgi:hypothetical protein
MKLSRRQSLRLATGVAALSAVSRVARGQGYPSRPVRVIVSSGPGSVFEWETALLFALSHVGQIEYEASAVDGPRPDIGFREAGGGSICFTADVATVSDSGLEADNPAMRFSLALHRLRKKYKLPGVLNFDIKGEAAGPTYSDRKMRLKLPLQAGLVTHRPQSFPSVEAIEAI